jgi:two-component system, sensor histidine kinase and response regulator
VPFHLRGLLEDALDLVAPQASAKGVEVIAAQAPDLPGWAVGDPGRLRQIINNLLSNAAKFTAQGEIQLSARARSQGPEGFVLELEVRDTGIGISAEAQQYIFDRFLQGDGSTTRKFGGTGLGLAIVERLLHEMGGQVKVTSAEGVGSRFSIQLPLGWAPAATATGLGGAGVEGDGTPLPVEVYIGVRHLVLRNVLEAQLRHWGIQVRQAPFADQSGVARGVLIDYETLQQDRDLAAPGAGVDPVIVLVPIHELAGVADDPVLARCRLLARPVRPSRLRAALAHQAPAPARQAVRPRWQGRVLLVEDNLANQLVMRELLTGLGLEVSLAVDGQAAVAAVTAEPPDLVLMDLHMPGMDGYQATAAIRAWEQAGSRVPPMPIIALSADAMPDVRARCLAAGMNDYLSKPLLHGDLIALLERWIGQQPGENGAAAPVPVYSQPPSSPDRETELDLAILNDLRCNVSADAYRRVVDNFLRVAQTQLQDIRSHLAAGRLEALAESLHRLKGGSATFGARQLPPLCKELELAARAGETGGLEAGVDRLEAAFQRLRDVLVGEGAPA